MTANTYRNHRVRFSKADRQYVYARDKGICRICFKAVPWFCFAVDHIKPVAFGGSSVLTNARLSHPSCNAKRGTGKNKQLTGSLVSTSFAAPKRGVRQ